MKVPAKIAKFGIKTSKEDILTLVSAFNPYPKKATKEFLVSRISHPMTNPAMWIKYLATGQIYYVHLPISYEITEVDLLREEKESSVPNHVGEMWMTLDEFMPHLSADFVSGECFSQAKLDESVKKSVVDWYMKTIRDVKVGQPGLPVFKSSKEAYISIVKEATNLCQNDPYTAWCFVSYATHTGAYLIGDKSYGDAAYTVFDYACRELAADVCPSITVQYFSLLGNRGKWDVFCDTAGEIQGLCAYTTQLSALKNLLTKYDGVAQQHIQTVITNTESRLRDVVQKLSNKRGLWANTTYYDEAVMYFKQNGITF